MYHGIELVRQFEGTNLHDEMNDDLRYNTVQDTLKANKGSGGKQRYVSTTQII